MPKRLSCLLPLAIAACTHCDGGGAARIDDAGADGPQDATTPRDTGADVRGDVDLGEAGAGWRIYSELPDCNLQVALDPVAAASKIDWIGCPSNSASCEQVDTTGWESSNQPGSQPEISYARFSPTRDFFVMARFIPLGIGGFDVAVYATPSFAPVQVWRTLDVKCLVLPAFGDKNAALIQDKPTIASVASGPTLSVLKSPSFALMTPSTPAKQDVAYWAMSDTTLSFDIQPLHEVARLPVGQASYVYTKGLKLSEPIVVGDDVYAHHEYGVSGWNGIVRVNADGSTTAYRYVAQRHVSNLRADASWVVWIESYGDPSFANFNQPIAELWGAPYTNDPNTLAATAKKIATLPGVRTGLGDPILSGGYYAITSWLAPQGQHTLYVVRVADGTVKTLDVNALVGPEVVHPYFLGRISSLTPTEITGVLSQENWKPQFGFVRLKLGLW